MALGTKPSPFVDGNELTADQLNALVTLLEIFGFTPGSGGTGQGTIDDDNVKNGANINKSKVGDTAFVLTNAIGAGTQVVQRPSTVSGGAAFLQTARSGWAPDVAVGNEQDNALVGAAQAIALVAGKGLYDLDAGAAATLSTVTGGAEGDVIYLYTNNVNVTINHTATDTANTIWLRGLANLVGTVGGVIVKLCYKTLPGQAQGRWFEVS